jgi:hypothetical protein
MSPYSVICDIATHQTALRVVEHEDGDQLMGHLSDLTRTQWFILAFGAWFTFGNYLAGTLIWPSTITDPNAMHFTHLAGFVPVMVNGWHLYYHLITGAACLALGFNHRAAVTAGIVVGAIYIATGVVGLVAPGNIYGLIMADTFGNWVHVAEGAGLLLASASAAVPRPASSARRIAAT